MIEASSRASYHKTAARLLGWYDRHARDVPWRARPGERPDPYAVWLSEIMLQQTTVKAVAPYYRAFLARWPRVDGARRRAGRGGDERLGRARLLFARPQPARLRAARRERHGGRFPDSEAALRPAGHRRPYTAAAMAAIAFGRRAPVVDGNVERVVAALSHRRRPCRPRRPKSAPAPTR
jgi:A/G-specific adenine glycosylase